MRKITKMQLAVLVGATIATGVTQSHASETTLGTVQVYGWYSQNTLQSFNWLAAFGFSFNYPSPSVGEGSGQSYSASPNTHTVCLTNKFSTAQQQGSKSSPSQPTNASLPIPMRYQNPIDIQNISSYCTSAHGGRHSSGSTCIFANLADGVAAAQASATHYSTYPLSYNITQLINTWAPPNIPGNANALSNTLADLNISPAMANETDVWELTGSQVMELIGAFAWQEGYKPSGC